MSDLLDKRLVLVLGKGGVGRSTVAAAIAAAAAKRGRRTLLFQANASDRFGDLLGGGTVVQTSPTRLRDNLYAVNTNPSVALEEYGLMILKFRRVYRMVFENRVTKYFLRAIPGLDEYSILGKAWYHTTEQDSGRPSWDNVVFDMPASGHTLSMLRIPRAILASYEVYSPSTSRVRSRRITPHSFTEKLWIPSPPLSVCPAATRCPIRGWESLPTCWESFPTCTLW